MNPALIRAWRTATARYLRLCEDPEVAAAYQELRYRYTFALARLFSRGQDWGPVVYGVWLSGHSSPVYIGQTTQAKRRLWDLPIGESHHLGFTFPPEVWERVVVVDWNSVVHANLFRGARFVVDLARELGLTHENAERAIGLALEHRLQKDERPLFNSRTKRNDGGWRHVDLDRSKGLAARAAPYLDTIYPSVKSVWDELASVPVSDRQPMHGTDRGYAFFPQAVWASLAKGLRGTGHLSHP